MARSTQNMWALAEGLQALPDEWLLQVLGEVFARRRPYGPEGDRYFVGMARRPRDPRTGAWEGAIGRAAVAYPDPEHYGGHPGPDYGFCQWGHCGTCAIELVSNCKNVLCPVCDGKAYLT